jgi:hypothetical protein
MNYESERGNPPTSQCGSLTLLFDGYYLKLHKNGNVKAAWHARSGREENGYFNYSGERQIVSSAGPIPQGEYWIKPDEIRPGMFGDVPAFRRSWGSFRITIHPRPDTVTHGRGGFFIHGGAVFGSAGCIDLSWGMNLFVAQLREELPTERAPGGGWTGGWIFSTSCHIPLIVKYATVQIGYPSGLPGTPDRPAPV